MLFRSDWPEMTSKKRCNSILKKNENWYLEYISNKNQRERRALISGSKDHVTKLKIRCFKNFKLLKAGEN